MEFQTVVRNRKMIRAFKPGTIQKEVIERILDNATRGPSSGFTQGFEFLIFEGQEQTKLFWDYQNEGETPDSSDDKVMNAPLIIVPLADSQAYVRRYMEPDKEAIGRKSEEDWPAPYWFIDSAFAAMLILLTAVDAGLGAYYFSIGPTSRDITSFRKAFGIPEEYYPIGAIAVGRPAYSPPSSSLRRGRRLKSEIFHFSRW